MKIPCEARIEPGIHGFAVQRSTTEPPIEADQFGEKLILFKEHFCECFLAGECEFNKIEVIFYF